MFKLYEVEDWDWETDKTTRDVFLAWDRGWIVFEDENGTPDVICVEASSDILNEECELFDIITYL